MDKAFNKLKDHIENWKTQCGYDIPFDYEGLRWILKDESIRVNNQSNKFKQI